MKNCGVSSAADWNCGKQFLPCHCEERSDVDFERPPPVAESRERRSWAAACLGASKAKREGLAATRKSPGIGLLNHLKYTAKHCLKIATGSSNPRNDKPDGLHRTKGPLV